MLTICKRFHFDAAHFLPAYQGKCHNLHGHRWLVDVGISGEVNPSGSEKGMVMDFGRLKMIVNRYIDQFDHQLINDIFPDDPTAENLASYFFGVIEKDLLTNYDGIILEFVRIWETEDAYAEWRKE